MGLVRSLSKLVSRPRQDARVGTRANRVAPTLSDQWDQQLGVGRSWMPLSYGEYYPRSALIYSAIKVRQDAVTRVSLTVYRRVSGFSDGSAGFNPRRQAASDAHAGDSRRPGGIESDLSLGSAGLSAPGLDAIGERQRGRRVAAEAVGVDHPVQRLLDSPNPFWTRGDLWRATETYLGLWGSAYWGLERNDMGQVVEIWPLRSDRMRVLPDTEKYIKGFVYVGQGQRLVPYVPEDVVWIRYFNPLEEYAGLSPIAPLRLSADMGLDALRANRNALTNDSTPGVFIETGDTPTDDEVKEFYERWQSRFMGVDKVRRPILLSGGMKASSMGFSPRDMEYIQSLRWSLEDVARVYGVPKAMLGDLERITFSNFQTARRVFWEDTIVPQLTDFQESLQQNLLPNLGRDTTGLFIEFDLSTVEALRENENDKAKRRETYVNTGILTINEARQEMNLPPVEWGDRPPGDGG